MKRLLLYALLIFSSAISVNADVVLSIKDGIDNKSVKEKMEKSASRLLTEINKAQAENRTISFSGLSLPSSVQSSLSMLWEDSHFMCSDDEVVEHCISTGSGYQVRNIPLLLKPTDGSKDNDEYQEAVLNFDAKGNITSFYIAIGMNLYMNVVKSNLGLTDLRRRQLILDYVEQFRTSYNKKDMKFLQQVFSDDALIITGKVIKQTKDGIQLPDKISYTKQNKQQYLTNLSRVFAANKHIKVTFDEVEVMRHPANVDFYGVTLHQGYTSDRYHDDGYIFLLWDFRDESHPKIHVRTWQPDSYNDGTGTKRLPRNKIFTLSDFDI